MSHSMPISYSELSKMVSHALRHEPEKYGLKLDSEGWVAVDELLRALNNKLRYQNSVAVSDLQRITEESKKRRHQILNGRIRAVYGHSIKGKLIKDSSIPPSHLFHGTIIENIEAITQKGLLPMKRQYVHLSVNERDATRVASRRSDETIILKVDSLTAHIDGIAFYKEEGGIWLSDQIPPKYIKVVNKKS